MNRFRSNLLLFLASTLICLFIAEIAVRFLFSAPEFGNRFLMWSTPHFVLDENDAVRYIPNERVREIAVYNGAIEYDARYQTNNMGLIDYIDYFPDREQDAHVNHIAFVGDSMTAGSGAGPWVPRLRDRIRERNNMTRIYNLGVAGTGLEHFYKLLVSIGKEIKFNEIVVLAISNDFDRPFWRPLTSSQEIRFCPLDEDESVCAKRTMVASVIPYDATETDILTNVAERQRRRQLSHEGNEKTTLPDRIIRVLKNSRLFTVLYDVYNNNPVFAAGEKTQRVSKALKRLVEKGSFQALEEIREAFPDIPIRLIHLPERHELRSGRYDLDLRNEVERRGITYMPALEWCSWTENIFHPTDPHPNAHGYAVISRCVEGLLFSQKPNR